MSLIRGRTYFCYSFIVCLVAYEYLFLFTLFIVITIMPYRWLEIQWKLIKHMDIDCLLAGRSLWGAQVVIPIHSIISTAWWILQQILYSEAFFIRINNFQCTSTPLVRERERDVLTCIHSSRYGYNTCIHIYFAWSPKFATFFTRISLQCDLTGYA